jgi:predicted esterase
MHVLIRFCIVLWLVSTAVPASMAQSVSREFRVLYERFVEAYESEDWPSAIEIGLELQKLDETRAATPFNLACVYARAGEPEESARWLLKSAQVGFDRPQRAIDEDDLSTIIDLEDFDRAIARMEENQARERERLDRRLAQDPPVVIVPKGHDASEAAPLIIALHGFGGRPDGYPTYWKGAAASIGAILAAPAGGQDHRNGGYYWRDPVEGAYIVSITLAHVEEQFAIDHERIVLTGFSQGGYVATAMSVMDPASFVGVVPMANPYRPELDAPPDSVGAFEPRYYFMVGERDALHGETKRAADDFEAAGYDVRFRAYPAVGHTFPRRCTAELRRALEYVMARDDAEAESESTSTPGGDERGTGS